MEGKLVNVREQVVVLDNLSTGFDWTVPPGEKLGDRQCRAVAALMEQHRVDAVLHFAASIVVPEQVGRAINCIIELYNCRLQFWQNRAKLVSLFNGPPFTGLSFLPK
jgi:UDP-glucose 4-epimerase